MYQALIVATHGPELVDALLAGDALPLPPQKLEVVRADGSTATLQVDAVLRHLPGKRVTLRCRLGDRAVSVKLFSQARGGARHLRRELLAFRQLSSAGIETPLLLGDFATNCGRAVGLIHEWIDDASDLASVWSDATPAQCQRWLGGLVEASARMHQAGACQTDSHFGNFLVRGEQLWVLDLGQIQLGRKPLDRSRSMVGLGLLGAQLTPAEQFWLEDLLPDYAAYRGWSTSEALARMLRNALGRAWERRCRDYVRKALRRCSLTHFHRDNRQLLACRRSHWGEDARRFAADPDDFMAHGEVLKSGNTATVVKQVFDGRPVVIKRYNIKHWRHALSRALRPTRALHSWRSAHLLELAGIPSPSPVMLLEQRLGPLHGTAYLVCEWMAGPDLLQLGRERALTELEFGKLADILSKMVRLGISHGDFKATNLLMSADGPVLIDLDGLRRHRLEICFRRAFGRDLERLRRNWRGGDPVAGQIKALIEGLW